MITGGAAISGGGTLEVSGLDETSVLTNLQEWEQTEAAKGRKVLFDRLINALKEVVGPEDLKGLDTDDEDAVIKKLTKIFPSKRNGIAFKDSTKHQRGMCTDFAKALNKQFTPGATEGKDMFIDTNMKTEVICEAVTTWVNTFAAGINTEFFAVQNAVQNAMRNVTVVLKFMNDKKMEMDSIVEKQGDSGLKSEYEKASEAFKRLSTLLDQTTAQLDNLLKLKLGPAEGTVQALLRDSEQTKELVKLFKSGEKDSGKSMSEILGMTIETAVAANAVRKAMKSLGISDPKLFMKMNKDSLDYLLMNQMMNTSDPAKLTQDIAVLRESLGFQNDSTFEQTLGAGPELGTGMSLEAKNKALNEGRSLIVKSFAKAAALKINQLTNNLFRVAEQITTNMIEIEDVDLLSNSLFATQDANLIIQNNPVKIIKYDLSPNQDKEEVIQKYKEVIIQIKRVIADSKNADLKSLLMSLSADYESMCMLVEQFHQSMKNSYTKGGGDIQNILGETVSGSGNDLFEGGDTLTASQQGLDINSVIGKFKNANTIVQFKKNMQHSAKTFKTFGENYEKVLGSEIARAIEDRKRDFEEINKILKEDMKDDGDKTKLKVINDFLINSWSVEKRTYDTIQAIELYLKSFTVDLVSNPEEVRDLYFILSGTKLMSDLFDSKNLTPFKNCFEWNNGAHDYKTFNECLEEISNYQKEFAPVKNILALFSHVGDKFNGESVHSKVFMSPKQMFKNLTDYFKYSNFLVSKVPLPVGTETLDIKLYTETTKNRGNYYSCFNQFVMRSINAMLGKILLTTSISNMFTGKITQSNDKNLFLRSKMITGGGNEKIIPDAATMYFRLIRIVEYYAYLFEEVLVTEHDKDSGKNRGLYLVPISSSIFNNLVRFVFNTYDVSGNTAKFGNYNDSEINFIIKEINSIYQKYHTMDPDNCNRLAMIELIDYINTCYGVFERDSITERKKARRAVIDQGYEYSADNTSMFDDMLPGDDFGTAEKWSPSSVWSQPYSAAESSTLKNISIDANHTKLDAYIAMIEDFVDVNTQQLISAKDNRTFSSMIKKLSLTLKSTYDNESQWQHVKSHINTLTNQGNFDKSFIENQTYFFSLKILDDLLDYFSNFYEPFVIYEDRVKVPALKDFDSLGQSKADSIKNKIYNSALHNIIKNTLQGQESDLIKTTITHNGSASFDLDPLLEAINSAIKFTEKIFENDDKYPVMDKYLDNAKKFYETMISLVDRDQVNDVQITTKTKCEEKMANIFNEIINNPNIFAVFTNLIYDNPKEYKKIQQVPNDKIQKIGEIGAKEERRGRYINIGFDPTQKAGNGSNVHNLSLLEELNYQIKLILDVSTHSATQKLYTPVIQNYAYGVASAAVDSPELYAFINQVNGADISNASGGIGAFNAKTKKSADIFNGVAGDAAKPGMGKKQSYYPVTKDVKILYSSSAYQLKQHFYSTVKGVKIYTFETLSEVPTHMKENMKAHFPIILLKLNSIKNKCAAIRKLFVKTADSNNRYFNTTRNHNLIDLLKNDKSGATPIVKTDKDVSTVMKKYLDEIPDHCDELIKGLTEVLADLGEKPKFMELYSGFYDRYSSRNGGNKPIIPASVMSAPLGSYRNVFNKWYANGTSESKVVYALSSFLTDGVSSSDIDMMIAPIKQYNTIVSASARYDELTYKNLLTFASKIYRSLVTQHIVGVELENLTSIYSTDIISNMDLEPQEYTKTTTNTRYGYLEIDQEDPITKSNYYFQEVVDRIKKDKKIKGEMAADADDDSEIDGVEVYEYNEPVYSEADKERYENVISNMLEINISPVSYQVLMRDMPLVNTVVYSNFFNSVQSDSHFTQMIIADDLREFISGDGTTPNKPPNSPVKYSKEEVENYKFYNVKNPISDYWNILKAKYSIIKTLLKKSISERETEKRIRSLTRFTDF